jgi:hypothetical protein
VIYHYYPSAVSSNSHYQLFHLASDPFEQKDLSTTHPKELQRLMKSLIVALNEHKALYPQVKDSPTPDQPVMP